MKIKFGKGLTEYGPGVEIKLDSEEVAIAIEAYILAHGAYISGSRTIKVNDVDIRSGYVYIDPSGSVITKGVKFSGRGIKEE